MLTRAWRSGTAIASSFSKFGLTLDGTLVVTKAECVLSLCLVHRETWHIIELVIHLKLYDESFLNGEDIAKHILDAMVEYDLDVNKWQATMPDCRFTNKGALVVSLQQIR